MHRSFPKTSLESYSSRGDSPQTEPTTDSMLLLSSWHSVACSRLVRESCPDDVHPDVRRLTMAPLPGGTVTFLFTDIEGSTALWEQDRQAMAAAVERHFALLGEAVA